MEPTIKLFIIEDHDVTVGGIRGYFRASRDQICVIGAAPTVDEALIHPAMEDSTMILLDLWINDTDPVDNLARLRTKYPHLPVVIFTSEISPLWQTTMMEGGAMGYIPKTASRTEIKTLLKQINRGISVQMPLVPEPKNEGNQQKDISARKYSLTDHQKSLLKLLATGMKQHAIAKELGITRSTIEKSLKHLRIKFGVSNSTELIQIVIRNQLI